MMHGSTVCDRSELQANFGSVYFENTFRIQARSSQGTQTNSRLQMLSKEQLFGR